MGDERNLDQPMYDLPDELVQKIKESQDEGTVGTFDLANLLINQSPNRLMNALTLIYQSKDIMLVHAIIDVANLLQKTLEADTKLGKQLEADDEH